jgi:alpha-mannosidase
MPKAGSFLAIDAKNVVISAVKRSEDGKYTIIRCVETYGLQTTATLDLRLADNKWTGNFRPCEIKTLRWDKETSNVKEVNLLEE